MSLVLENPKVDFRSIIGQRKLMEEKGQKIVLKLLEAAILLEQDNFFLRTIQPMSTRFTEDLEKVVFIDLRSAITTGERATFPHDYFPPYKPS